MKLIRTLKTKLKNALTYNIESKLDTFAMCNAKIISHQHLERYKQIILHTSNTSNIPLGGRQSQALVQLAQCDLQDFEFRVFSQNGEDGMIDFLVEILGLDSSACLYPHAFVEFGVQNYTESNTRFLLKKRNWQGLVMDGSQEYIHFIQQDEIYWRHDLEAKCAFITRENINTLIQQWLESRKLENVALLSIDIDGVDYFVWEAITCITPAIVVIEFNALFGDEKHISVPYREDFDRFKAHYSGLYFGASINALITLGKTKGYNFVGADSSGTNLFFVHKSLESKTALLKTKPLKSYCNQHNARQSRDTQGRLNFISGEDRQRLIQNLPLYTTYKES